MQSSLFLTSMMSRYRWRCFPTSRRAWWTSWMYRNRQGRSGTRKTSISRILMTS